MLDHEAHKRVKQALKAKGSSFAKVARAEGVKPSTVSLVCNGWRRSRRVELAIANVLELGPEEVWPERYNSEKENTSI